MARNSWSVVSSRLAWREMSLPTRIDGPLSAPGVAGAVKIWKLGKGAPRLFVRFAVSRYVNEISVEKLGVQFEYR